MTVSAPPADAVGGTGGASHARSSRSPPSPGPTCPSTACRTWRPCSSSRWSRASPCAACTTNRRSATRTSRSPRVPARSAAAATVSQPSMTTGPSSSRRLRSSSTTTTTFSTTPSPGALATALQRAGIDRAVIGNGDRSVGRRRVAARAPGCEARPRHRPGSPPEATCARELLEADAGSPFGVRTSSAAYLAAFRKAWTGRTVVMVEDSDLTRLTRCAGSSPPRDAPGSPRCWRASIGSSATCSRRWIRSATR